MAVWQGLELLNPNTGAILPESTLWKKGLVLSSAGLAWSGIQLERRWIAPIEWPEFALDSYTVCMMLHDTPLSTHQFWQGQWHTRQINPGEVYVYSAGSPMKVAWDTAVPHMNVAIDPIALRQCAWQNNARSTELVLRNYCRDEVLYHLTMLLHAEANHGGQSGALFVESVATALSSHLLSKYAAFPTTFKEYHRGLGKADLKRVTDYLHHYLAADVSLETLAGLVAVSPYHFCRLFKQSTGFSPHQYVIHKRVERAKALLQNNEQNVSEVAAAVGFCSPAHLNRHMKRLLGVTPSQWRSGGGNKKR